MFSEKFFTEQRIREKKSYLQLMLKIDFRIILMTFGVFKASSNEIQFKSTSPAKKAGWITAVKFELFLNHPEFAETLRSFWTKDQDKLFFEISKLGYECFSSSLGENEKTEACCEIFMKNYEIKKVDDLIDLIKRVIQFLPKEKIQSALHGYFRIFRFYTKIVQKSNCGMKLINQFDEKEQKFIEVLVEKHNKWFFHHSNMYNYEDFAAYMKDNQLYHSVLEKVEQLEEMFKIENRNHNNQDPDDICDRI